MEDKDIIELYFKRDEQAIKETSNKYGAFCYRIAMNVLSIKEDADECVNDTYLAAWKQIPPTNPQSFCSFLGRITRNISISRFRSIRAKKRYNGIEIMLSELNDCIPSGESLEMIVEAKRLAEYISDWLESLPVDDCALFVRRYWFGDEVWQLAKECGITQNQMAQRMFQLRKKLRNTLEKKGVTL